MKFAIDLTKIQELKPIPAGSYVMKIIEVDGTKTSRSSGKPKLTIKNEVLAPIDIAKEIKNWYLNLSLAEGAQFRVKQLFEACLVPIKPGSFDTVDLVGREYGITVTLEPYTAEGQATRLTNQIVAFHPAKLTKPELAPVQPVASQATTMPAAK
jgi:hypothetical protein